MGEATATSNIALVAEGLSLLGSAYRGDWSDFDGRTLRVQLDELAVALTSDEPFDLPRWAATQNICTKERAWADHCPEDVPLPDDHPARSKGMTHYLYTCPHVVAALSCTSTPGSPDA